MSSGPEFVCRADDVPEGRPCPFTVGRAQLLLVRRGENVYALNDRCPHRKAALSKGVVGGTALPSEVGTFRYGRDGEILRCPWHGWEFDVTNGRSLHDPARERVRAYPISVEDGRVYVDLGGRVDAAPRAGRPPDEGEA